MIRLFIYLLIILAMGFGFAWIADHPGVVTLQWQGKDIRTSLMVVVVAIVAVIAVILFVWGILRGVIGFPSLLSRFFTNRRRDRGYDALSKGLIAAGTGDKILARQLTKESGKLLSNEPLVELLEAQTALLEGDHSAARDKFQTMLENDDTKLLGLRGLYLEAERDGEREATRQYAQEAAQLAPSLAWAGNAKLRNQCMDGDWEAALGTLESNRSAGLIDKDTAKRHRAVLLTARAISEEPANPELAVKLAKEAHRLVPDLVPAAVIGARALVRGNNLRKASKLIEATWKINPHPELAQSYVHLRMGDSASDRLQRARDLAKLRTHHQEGNIAIAEAAMDAKEWGMAREAMKPVLTNDLSERACLIMADMEEGEHGDGGRMREWLSRAVRAPRDAAWSADGYISQTWLPVLPTTGAIDVFEWKVPVEQLQEPAAALDISDLVEPLKVLAVAVPDEQAEKTPSQENDDGADDSSDTSGSDETGTAQNGTKDKPVIELVAVEEKNTPDVPTNEVEPGNTVFPLKRRPDDPGVEADANDKSSKLKLF